MLRRPALVGLAIALVVPIAACTQATRLPESEPSSEVAPLFASDEEALAAATAAYEEYLVLSSAASADPNFDRSELLRMADVRYFDEVVASIDALHAEGLRTEGVIGLRSASLQQYVSETPSDATIIIYACIDVSSVRVVDQSGTDRTPAERQELVPLEVEIWAAGRVTPSFAVARSESWPEGSICEE
ncbi:hypothetical protein [Microcella sp.]|uniref:hypothetical protein n=1 Tax=Microcella sp. TaxID=1913979 RepID=UPI00255DEED1|nr:hypothetical protein [Microcella sp.]MBX9472899.1 hypothetical protein [Microcella sp.]